MLEELLVKIAKTFSNKNIPYMIIGGQAVLIYGEPRLTRDIDITLGVNTDKLDVILECVKSIGLKPLPEDGNKFVEETLVLPCLDKKTEFRIDFIFSYSLYEQEAIKRVKLVKIYETDVAFASPEDVIIHKIFAKRPRDLEDVKNIMNKMKEIDVSYIKKWLKEFDLLELNEHYLETFDGICKEI
ncbi:nucleotidyl transferase AbiEii/AbiGii toxin family protein [Chlamydiota bacterium]